MNTQTKILLKITAAENIVNDQINGLIDDGSLFTREYKNLAMTMGVLGIARLNILEILGDVNECQERVYRGVDEHKHTKYNWWHPVTRIHEEEGE